MNKILISSLTSLVVGIAIGVFMTNNFEVDLLSTQHDIDLVLTEPLTLRNGSGHEMTLPVETTVSIRSIYQEDATLVLEFVADTAILKQTSAEAGVGAMYYLQ